MLSQDYYGFPKKARPKARPIHRTELSQQKLSHNKSSKQKQSMDDLRLEKLKEKYNLINSSNAIGNGNASVNASGQRFREVVRDRDRGTDRERSGERSGERDWERDRQRERERSRKRSRRDKYRFKTERPLGNQMRLRTLHYNDEGAVAGYNQMRRRVQKKAQQTIDKNFHKFNTQQGKQHVSEHHIRQAEQILSRKPRNIYLDRQQNPPPHFESQARKSHSNSNLNSNLRSSSNSHRNLRRMRVEEKQQLSENRGSFLEVDLDAHRSKESLPYSQKESMLLGTQTIKKYKGQELQEQAQGQGQGEQGPKLATNKQQFDQSLISINSRHQNKSQASLSVLRSSDIDQPQKPQILATSDYQLIKQLQKRARAEQSQSQSQTQKQYNKISPLSSSYIKQQPMHPSHNANILESQSQSNTNSNTLSKVIKNSSDIMRRDVGESSRSSRYSGGRDSGYRERDSGYRESGYRESGYGGRDSGYKGSAVYGDFVEEKEGREERDGRELGMSGSGFERRKPIEADKYEEFIHSLSRANYENSNSSLNISKSIHVSYLPYQHQQNYQQNSASLQSSLKIQPLIPQPQQSIQPHFIPNSPILPSPLQPSLQTSLQASQPLTFNPAASASRQPSSVQSSVSYQREESVHNGGSGDRGQMDGNRFSFILTQQGKGSSIKTEVPREMPKEITKSMPPPLPAFKPVAYEYTVPQFGTGEQRPQTEHSIVLHDQPNNPSLQNQFMFAGTPFPDQKPSYSSLPSFNLLESIQNLNSAEQKKISSLYSTLGFENESVQNLMDRLYDHLACVNKIIDFVGETQEFYVDRRQREIFHGCSYLLVRIFAGERGRIVESLGKGESCFQLVGKQIPQSKIEQHLNNPSLNQFIANLQDSTPKIQQILQNLYQTLPQTHPSLPSPQTPNEPCLPLIYEKLNEELELLIQKIDDNAAIKGSNSFMRDNQYQAISMRAFGVMELAFLISGLRGRNVKRVWEEIQPEDFELYCKNNYGSFKETVLYFH